MIFGIDPQFLVDPVDDVSDVAFDFQGIDFLVGGVWTTADSSMVFCEAVSLVLNQKFLNSGQTTAMVNGTGASMINGFLGGTAADGRIRMWAFATSGSFVQLRQRAIKKPPGVEAWGFQGKVVGASSVRKVRNLLTKISETELQTESEERVNGQWVPLQKLTYRRS